MQHRQQPRRSRVCGQTCVAMLADVSLERAKEACTGGLAKATSEHDLRAGLASLGFRLNPFRRWSTLVGTKRLCSPIGSLPHYRGRSLVRVRYEGRPHTYHWIALDGLTVHDPGFDTPVSVETYERVLRRARGYVTSWAEVIAVGTPA